MEIQTQRLLLRPWKDSDYEDVFTFTSVPGVLEPSGLTTHKTMEDTISMIRTFQEKGASHAVEYGGRVIGFFNIKHCKPSLFPEFAENNCCEFGFTLGKEYWGKGLMPEAVKAASRWCFETAHMEFIICCHFPENEQSARVQKKCGFTFYKRLQVINHGVLCEEIANILWNPQRAKETQRNMTAPR